MTITHVGSFKPLAAFLTLAFVQPAMAGDNNVPSYGLTVEKSITFVEHPAEPPFQGLNLRGGISASAPENPVNIDTMPTGTIDRRANHDATKSIRPRKPRKTEDKWWGLGKYLGLD